MEIQDRLLLRSACVHLASRLGVALRLAFLPLVLVAAAATRAESGAEEVRWLRNTDAIWQMSNDERRLPYRISIEGRINFFDPAWRNLWFEEGGIGRYIALSANPPKLRNGQRVRIEGTYVPIQGLAAERVTVTVLEEVAAIAPLATRGRISEVRAFDRAVVEAEGYVDEQLSIDDYHLRLTLLTENRRVICWVPPDSPTNLPEWQGNHVRLRAVYSGRVDPSGTDATIELWVGKQSDVEVIGSIDNAPVFDRPLVSINSVNALPVGTVVRLRGKMAKRDIGSSFVLRDDSGDVFVECLQRETVNRTSLVEVVGTLAISGSRWVVRNGFFREIEHEVEAAAKATEVLSRIEAIRQLSEERVSAGQPVSIAGIVTWSLPEADVFFLQDQTGGVRVRLPAGVSAPPLQKWVRVEGATAMGAFAPLVEMRTLVDLGSMAHPLPERLTYSQAISGREDGQWVEMRGFIRRTASEGDWRWIYVTTPDGEFVGHLQSPVNFVATPGSLLRVRGVCEVTTDAKNRINGVRLRIPFLHDILIEEDAPADIYDLPLRRVGDLRPIGVHNDLVRVHVQGRVLHHVPGQYLILEDEEDCIGVFSREPGQLVPGERVDVVGILGQDGARVVLREAVFRHTGEAPTAPATELVEPASFDRDDDLHLVRIEGRLLDYSRHAEQLHLTLQTGNEIFDAVLDHAPGASPEIGLTPGMVLAATGIYRIEYDDFHRPSGFDLQLRSGRDLAVVAAAKFWTVDKALGVAGTLLGLTLVVAIWVFALRLRVRVQTAQIRAQLEKQTSLEAELERSQRFRSLGLLAGGLAHDFNNLLTGILGNVTLAMLEERAMPLVGECLKDIEASAKRARDLTQQLVTFAKGGDPMRDNVDLVEMLHQAAGFALSGAKARAEFDLAEGLWPVHADRNQLGRALQNLLIHSRGAMPEGGIVKVSASNCVEDSGRRNLHAGRYVQLRFEDSGPGIPAEQIPAFFDPYSATKFGDDRFSLAIAYSIVKRHGGHIEVRSAAGRGSEFNLWIPAGDSLAPVAPQAPVEAPGATAIQGTRILLMDDEETIRSLAERLLHRMGCEVKTVGDGESCLAAYREAMAAGRPFQIVILDLTVPGGMGGLECMEALLRIDAHVRGIVSSGYSHDPVMSNHRAYGFRAVVPKPYVVGALTDCIRQVLGAPQ